MTTRDKGEKRRKMNFRRKGEVYRKSIAHSLIVKWSIQEIISKKKKVSIWVFVWELDTRGPVSCCVFTLLSNLSIWLCTYSIFLFLIFRLFALLRLRWQCSAPASFVDGKQLTISFRSPALIDLSYRRDNNAGVRRPSRS